MDVIPEHSLLTQLEHPDPTSRAAALEGYDDDVMYHVTDYVPQ